MRSNHVEKPRPLGPATPVGKFTVRLRPGALRCECGRVFLQHDVEELADGLRFACTCGVNALEVLV